MRTNAPPPGLTSAHNLKRGADARRWVRFAPPSTNRRFQSGLRLAGLGLDGAPRPWCVSPGCDTMSQWPDSW